MSQVHGFEPAGLAFELAAAVLWSVLAQRTWWILRTRRPASRFYALLPLLAALLALQHGLLAASALLLPDGRSPARLAPPAAFAFHAAAARVAALGDAAFLLAVATFRHLGRYLPARERPPRAAWLAVAYGSAAAVGALRFAGALYAGSALEAAAATAVPLWLALAIGGALVDAWPAVRAGTLGHAGLTAIRTRDVGSFVVGLLIASVVVTTRPAASPGPGQALAAADLLATLAMAAPFAARLLGEVIRGLVVAVAAIAVAALVVGAALSAGAAGGLEHGAAIVVGAAILLALALVPGQQRLRATVERVIFRRSQLRARDLQVSLHALPAQLGVTECCRRALGDLMRVMRLRGAGCLFAHEDVAVVEGQLSLDSLRTVWPRGEAAAPLFAPTFGLLELRELPAHVREPLVAAQVVAVFSVASPARAWGHLFLSGGPLAGLIDDDDGRAIEAFAQGLALVFDAADLLSQVAAAERSLAHAGKLAAIGEVVARVVHDIRNPVTAARSLAQTLERAVSGSEDADLAVLIVEELGRIEHQVQNLLRYARKDELERESADLAALAHDTVARMRLRTEGTGVTLAVAAAAPAPAWVDRERIRQVLVNLIENALDALAGRGGGTVTVSVARSADRVRLVVADDGPGVPPDVLPRLFEPFFTSKPHGTGLGLANAQRTVVGHGGRIEAVAAPGGGLEVRIELPTQPAAV